MIEAFKSTQFLAFLITGGLAAVVNFVSRIIYNQWLDFSIAIILAYCTGMFTAYVLAKLFVFKESARALHQSILYFIAVNIVAVAQTWAISMLLLYYLLPILNIQLFAAEIAHGIGVIVPVFSSYLGHKYFSFK